MKSKLDQIIEAVSPKNKQSVSEAVNRLLIETDAEFGKNRVSVGDTVAMQDDPTYPSGIYGKVRNIDEKGYAEVEWPNGVKVRAMISLLYPVHAQ